MPLHDDVIVYPAHGAGSACGKNMMKETVDSLEIKENELRPESGQTKEEFIQEVTEGCYRPSYFPLNVKMNKSGYEDIDAVLDRGTQALTR